MCDYIVSDAYGSVYMQSKYVNGKINIHSTAKLIQALPIYLLNLRNKYSLTTEEMAILSSSTIGQTDQIQVIKSVLYKTEISENELHIFPCSPKGHIALKKWKRFDGEYRKIYHPCIGNHISLFLTERELSGNGADYLNFNSAANSYIFKILSSFCHGTDIMLTRDTCGAPAYLITLHQLADLYRNIALLPEDIPSSFRMAASFEKSMIRQNPTMLEGEDCLASVLSSINGVVAKTGAGGILALGLEKEGIGIAIHDRDGNWNNVMDTLCNIFYHLINTTNRLQITRLLAPLYDYSL